MPGVLTRRIGPFPGWVWAVAAGGGFLLFMYVRKSNRPTAQTGGLPAVSPAASAVPFVPSVSVTGIPQTTSPGPGGLSGPAVSGQTVTAGSQTQGLQGFGNQIPVYKVSGGTYTQVTAIPFGTTLTVTGAPITAQNPGGVTATFLPVSLFGGSFYVAASDVSYGAGTGSGGFGYAGTSGLATPIGGWTVGWQPAPRPSPVSPGGGWGAGPSVNRTGAPRRARRLFGGSGGGTAVNRTGTRATRPLRRRTLSGR